MLEPVVRALLLLAGLYGGVGLAFAVWFVAGGLARLDATPISAAGRLALLPGAALLWPLLLPRSLRSPRPRGGRDERGP